MQGFGESAGDSCFSHFSFFDFLTRMKSVGGGGNRLLLPARTSSGDGGSSRLLLSARNNFGGGGNRLLMPTRKVLVVATLGCCCQLNDFDNNDNEINIMTKTGSKYQQEW